MKKQLSFLKFLILAVIFVILGFLLEKQIVNPNSQLPDTKHFKEILFEKEQQIDTTISNFHNRIKTLPLSETQVYTQSLTRFSKIYCESVHFLPPPLL